MFYQDISEDDKHRLLRTATVLILPSVRESFGVVLLEAWAAGTPVVAIDSPVIRDTVIDGIDGVLVPEGNDRLLAGALLDRLEDPIGSRTMGLACYARLESEYSWESAAARLEHAYRQTISRRSQDPS